MEPTRGVAPLTGIRVIEVGSFIAAPFCAMQLADLGAEVIKVEPPDGGDQTRLAEPRLAGDGSLFLRLNRNKRSVALDLKSDGGRTVLRQLAETADVLVENLRPGAMERLGLGYADLRVVNPRLIFVALSGWGLDGPLSSLPGLDIMAQARGGLMSVTGMPGGEPVKVGVPVCDLVCGLYGALAATAALRARDQTGRGQLIDVSLFESAVSLAVWEAATYFATGEIPRPHGSAHQNAAPYQAVRSADGWFTLGANTNALWHRLCQALGLEAFEADARFATGAQRYTHREELIALIEQTTQQAPTAHWIARLDAAGVPCSPIQDFGEVFTDPHLLARGFFWDAPHVKLGSVRQIGSPMRLSETPGLRGAAGPPLGSDTTAILASLGYDDAAIRELVKHGAVRTTPPERVARSPVRLEAGAEP